MSDEKNSAPAKVKLGDKIAGYRLEEQIGQGGMAVVYRAHDERLDRRVALKLLAPGLASDTAFRTRFIRESQAAAAVDHPNIIPVYDAGDAGGFLFIAMRYVQGGDVRALFTDGQVLSPARVWNIVSQVAAALDAAHEHNLIHRDVKPGNMLLDAAGGRSTGGKGGKAGDQADHVYLSDFGISKQTLASHLTSTGQFVGTLDYIAPEQIEGRAIDGRVDEYSLACATYEMLTGDPPFRRDLGLALINAHLSAQPPSVLAKRPELPASIDLVLAKAMSKVPEQRYATCTEFATDLGKAVGTIPGTPSVAAAIAPTIAQAAAAAGEGDKATVHPPTELAGPAVVAGLAAQQAVAQASAPAAAAAPAASAAPQDAATQYAPGPPPGQTPPPQQQPGWQTGGQPGAPGGYWPQGQTPPPQQQPGGWQTGQPGAPGGYAPYQQFQPYQTGPGGPPVQPYQTGPVGPPIPGWQTPPQQPKRSRGVLIGSVITLVLVIGIAVGAVLYLNSNKGHTNAGSTPPPSSSSSSSQSSSPPSSTAAGPSAQSEATAVNSLLLNSANSRLQWNSNTLTNDVGSCVYLNSAVTQIGDIAKERSSELNQAQALQTGAIPNGATLKSQLMTALQISLSIDNDYLGWAKQQQSSGCTVGTNSSYYQSATSQDPQATADKMTFLNTWDPIASQYGLQQFTAGQI